MLNAELAELRTRAAVLEEQACAARADAECQREALRAQATCLAGVGAAAIRAAVEAWAGGGWGVRRAAQGGGGAGRPGG